MAEQSIATAYITLIPSLRGAQAEIESQLGAIDGTRSGEKLGGSIAKGIGGAKFGAIAGAAATVVNRAMSAISSSMGGALRRVDTLNNFGKVMGNLGYSAEEASKVFETLSERLDGLPTSMDGMISMVQQLAPLTGGLKSATEVGLAFNDMLLAGGASTADQTRALTQYSQMLSQGVVDMQSWRSLQQVIPGQLNQMSEALLGAGKNSSDLYAAMKSGQVTFEDFNEAMLKLDKEGLGKYASFAEQAKGATGGIQTALDNLQNRLNKAVATLIDGFGADKIATMINTFSSSFGGIANAIKPAFEAMGNVVYWAFEKLPGIFESVKATMQPVADTAVSVFKQLSEAVGPLVQQIQESGFIEALSEFAQAVGGFAAGAVSSFVNVIGQIGTALVNIATAVIPFITPVLSFLAEGFAGLTPIIGNIIGAFGELAAFVGGVVVEALRQIGESFASAGMFIEGILPIVEGIPSAIGGALSAIGTVMNDTFNSIVGGITGAMSAAYSTVTGFVSSFTSAGTNLVQGIVNGIGAGADWVRTKISEICTNALDALKSFFGIHSPSKVMYSMGGYIMRGWANGIAGNQSRVVSAMGAASRKTFAAAGGFEPQLGYAYAGTARSLSPAQVSYGSDSSLVTAITDGIAQMGFYVSGKKMASATRSDRDTVDGRTRVMAERGVDVG